MPKTKGDEGHEAEPEALVDGVEPDPLDVHLLEEPPDRVELVDGLVLEQGNEEGPGQVEDNQGEVMTRTDEEGGLAHCLLELGGSGFGLVVGRDEPSEEVRKELEVQVVELEQKVGVVVGEFFEEEVVEVDVLEDLGDEEEGVGALEQEDAEGHQGHVADDAPEGRHRLSLFLHLVANVVDRGQGGFVAGLVEHRSLGVDHHVRLQEVYRERELVEGGQDVDVDAVGRGVDPGRVPSVAAGRHSVQRYIDYLLYLGSVHGDLPVEGENAVEFTSLGEALEGVLEGLYATLRGGGGAGHASEV